MTEFDPTTIPLGYTRDENGNLLTYRSSTGYWWECTRDENGRELTYRESTGRWRECTRDAAGRELTYRNSTGYWEEYTYDENGWIISCRKEHSTPWDINRRVIWHYN
jgi:YD repeat-containing protein